MDTEPDHSGRKRRGCLVRAVVAAVVVIAAALGVTWLLTRPPALPVIPAQYLPTIRSAAARCPEISVPLLAAQIDAESHWNPQADSGKAQGIAQFDPDTWAEWGRDHDGDGKADVWDPKDAIPSQPLRPAALWSRLARRLPRLERPARHRTPPVPIR